VVKSSSEALIREQVVANESGTDHHAAFETHRTHVTRLLSERAGDGGGRLCLLGAGNANDVDLEVLLERYREVHLVDIDPAALDRAESRAPEGRAKGLTLHAPVDVSGVLDRLERWGRLELTPEELIAHPETTSRALAARLGAPFDVVASLCLLTQIQRAPVALLGDSHPLFQAVRHTLTVTHLRTLHGLLTPNGRGLLVTDVSADSIHELPDGMENDEWVPLVDELVAEGKVFQVAQPELLRAITRDDPVLVSRRVLSPPVDAWIWQNGPSQRFLVYAAELSPRG
jgi:hypothetical protein